MIFQSVHWRETQQECCGEPWNGVEVSWWGSGLQPHPDRGAQGSWFLPKISVEVRISWQRQMFGNKSVKERVSTFLTAFEGF